MLGVVRSGHETNNRAGICGILWLSSWELATRMYLMEH